MAPAETVLYVARPGIGALPDGTGTAIAFAIPQLLMCCAFLWIIWFPLPRSEQAIAFDVTMTLLLTGIGGAMAWKIGRGSGHIAIGILRAPFIRLTVTNHRLIWTLPWSARPLMELEATRVMGGILGEADRNGRGTAAIILVPGDPAGDFENRIHLDRLPDAAGFVAALGRLG